MLSEFNPILEKNTVKEMPWHSEFSEQHPNTETVFIIGNDAYSFHATSSRISTDYIILKHYSGVM